MNFKINSTRFWILALQLSFCIWKIGWYYSFSLTRIFFENWIKPYAQSIIFRMHYYFFNICCWKYYIGPPFPPINWFIMSVRYTLVPFHFPLKSPGLIEKLIFLLIGEGKKQTFEKMEGGNIRLSKIAVRPLSKQRVGGRFGHTHTKKSLPASLSDHQTVWVMEAL